jgi:Zn-dependent protease/CBS domain-containing protein
MSRNTLPLGRVLGIPLRLDYSWFLIFALITWSLAVSYYPHEFPHWSGSLYWVIGAITAIMLFVSVLLHELGHSVLAMRFKVPVRKITLFIFGGIAQLGSEPPSAVAEFWIAVAGPAVSLALAFVFEILQHVLTGAEPLMALAKYLALINGMLFLFNLVPGFPLDGGRVLRAIVWGATKNLRRATFVAANVGRFIAFAFIFLGLWQALSGNLLNGIWIAFIGWFLDSAAAGQLHAQDAQDMMAGYKVAAAMNPQFVSIPSDMTLSHLVDEHILGSSQRCFAVTRGDRLSGLLTLHGLREIPRDQWATTTAEEAMIPFERLKVVTPDTELWTALEEMQRDGFNQLPVMIDDRVVGMLSREDTISFLQRLREFAR